MDNYFDQFVNRFTQKPLGLDLKRVHHIIADGLHDKVNSIIATVHDVHHKARNREGRLHLPQEERTEFIGQDFFIANISTAGFNPESWIKLLRDHATMHNEEYHRVRGQDVQVSQVELKHAVPNFNIKRSPFGNLTRGASDEDLELMIDRFVKTERLLEAWGARAATLEGAEAAAALAAGSAAFGPVAIAVAALFVLPLALVSIFETSEARLRSEMREEADRHEQALREMQAERFKARQDLAKHDLIVSQINEKSDLLKRRRDQEKKHREDEEEECKKKKHSYIGCVERIEPLEKAGSLTAHGDLADAIESSSYKQQSENMFSDRSSRFLTDQELLVTKDEDVNGYEIRLSCVCEGDLLKSNFQSQLKQAVGQDIPDILCKNGIPMLLCSYFVHQVPSGVSVGSEISFNLDRKTLSVSDGTFVLKPGSSFEDGLAMVEQYQVAPGWLRSQYVYFNINANGFNGIVSDPQANIPPKVHAVFDRINGALERATKATHYGIDQLLEGSEEIVQAKLSASNLSASRVSLRAVYPKNDIEVFLNTVAKKPQASTIVIADIGQGASQVIYDENKHLFISDFGYGRGPTDVIHRAEEIFKWDRTVPVILSHWDRDHYGIAMSSLARDELLLSKVDQKLPWERTWITPQLCTGILAWQLKRQIEKKGNLIEFPLKACEVNWGNITISNCDAIHGGKVDKNNNGALAFWYGSKETGYTFYPGDANYEAIRIPKDVSRNIAVMIATHHGSRRSITPAGKAVGDTIPWAASKSNIAVTTGKDNMTAEYSQPVALFSYGKGNSYNHSIDAVGNYYETRGYKTLFSTADLDKNNPKDGVCYFVAALPLQEIKSDMVSPEQPIGKSKNSFRTKTAPTASILEDDENEPSQPVLSDFPQELILEDDKLSAHAVSIGDRIQSYQVIASHLKIVAPLRVKCDQDFSVPVLIQCNDIEVILPESSNTLISFEVAAGPQWEGPAEAGQQGRAGKPSYAGGYLDLRVSGRWVVFDHTGNPWFDSWNASSVGLTLSIEYIGGKGGQGQQGGRGARGKDGADGAHDISGNVKGKKAESGWRGGKGAAGGLGGDPGWFTASRILATKDKIVLPSGKITFNTMLDRFGASGNGGEGGEGGPGGTGGLEGLRLNSDGKIDHQGSHRRAGNGFPGSTGESGEDGKKSAVTEIPVIRYCETIEETQMLVMLPSYWES